VVYLYLDTLSNAISRRTSTRRTSGPATADGDRVKDAAE
jgi:hypothetical protein